MKADVRFLRRRGFQGVVAVAAITVVSAFLWDVFQYGGAEVTKAADDVYSTAVPIAVAIACWVVAWRRRPPTPTLRRKEGGGPSGWGIGRPFWSWSLLGASAFFWGLGSATWLYFDVVTRQPVPFPSLADAGFLSAVPFAFIALTIFPSAPSRAGSRLRTLLDGAIIAGALLFVSWATVLGASYSQASGGFWEKAIGLAYPVSDVIMASVVLLILPRATGNSRVQLLLIGGGILANTVSDSVFTYLQLNNTYSGVSNAVDAGWILGYALIGLGAVWAINHPAALRQDGTGYSSLSYLSTFPVDSLKIDRSFISGLGAAQNEPLVATIMEMGQSLKLKVVAEGIERPEQLAELERLHCEIGQGYYFSKPITHSEMTAYLRARGGAQAA